MGAAACLSISHAPTPNLDARFDWFEKVMTEMARRREWDAATLTHSAWMVGGNDKEVGRSQPVSQG